VKCAYRWLVALALLLAALSASAATAMFYQPQHSDQSIAAAQWPRLFSQVRAQGFDTLVVQWTQYGEAFDTPAEHSWLLQRVREARAAGLNIVLGLASDPAFFTRQSKKEQELADYLHSLSRRDAEVARQWADELGGDAIAGWYLPIEIDDARWRDPKARRQLQEYLSTEQRRLDVIAHRPIYVTSFFAGNMTPSNYADLLADIQRSGVRGWVQDGAGVARLDQGARELYLDAVSQCAKAHASGIVYEIFRQVPDARAFTALALPSAETRAVLAQRAPCGGDTVFFELRYLPGMEVLLHAKGGQG
jgi:Domain of unknown function (DUF4434)